MADYILDVDVWIVDTDDLSPVVFDEGIDLLSDDENQRLSSISHAPSALTYRNSRILTRRLLAKKLNMSPMDLLFDRSDLGRPSLNGVHGVDFNISHCGSHYMIAIGRGVRVGVDIEYIKRRKQQDRIVDRHFSREEGEYYNSLSKDKLRDRYFHQIWTLKEAHSKALGVGFSEGFSHYDFDISDLKNITLRDSRGGDGVYKAFDMKEDVHASPAILAYAGAKLPRINVRIVYGFLADYSM